MDRLQIPNPLSFLLLFLLASVSWCQTTFDDDKFKDVVTRLESTVRELAKEVERLYAFRCDEETINSCKAANYQNCLSQFPSPQCPVGPYSKVEACGDADGCSSQWDMTTSSTRIPTDLANGVDGNPTDPKLIETLCFTRALDSWFVQKRHEDLPFWQSLGIDSPISMYFGSHNGGFRIFPARHTDNCDTFEYNFDPRTRPWYVAASSGPKNVIMILDVSGSINEDRLPLLKDAAKRVVGTLTVHDRITIIPFATNATKIADPNGRMFRATADNIAILSQEIDNLVGSGSTNFYDAFETAFDVFDATIYEELHANCNSAILFFTDGALNEGPKIDQVTQLVQNRLAAIKSRLNNKPILLFTYSISPDDSNSPDGGVHQYPLQLACAVEQGVWSRISSDDEIIESLSSYYQLFALGLGSDANEEFVAWVEPYDFFSGLLGTTVSAPVYDRTKTPHLFLGVVAVDIPLAAIDAALGAENQDFDEVRAESISRVVSSSRVICPLLDLQECELEAYRTASVSDGSGSCGLNCTEDELVQVAEEECPGQSDYPRNYWANIDVADWNYTNRTCCRVDTTSASEMCPGPLLYVQPTSPPVQSTSPNMDTSPTSSPSPSSETRTEIIASVVGSIVGVFVAAFLGIYIERHRRHGVQEAGSNEAAKPQNQATDDDAQNQSANGDAQSQSANGDEQNPAENGRVAQPDIEENPNSKDGDAPPICQDNELNEGGRNEDPADRLPQ